MGIRVQHDAAPAVVAQAAYLGGAGDLAKEYRNRADKYNLQANSFVQQSKMQASGQAQQTKMQDASFSQQSDMLDQRIGGQMDMAEYNNSIAQEKMGVAQDQWEKRFTRKQEAEIERLNNGISWADTQENSGALTPEQAMQFRAQFEQAKAGVRPQRFPKGKSPEREEIGKEIENNVHTDEFGNVYIRQPDGKLDFRPAPKKEKESTPEGQSFDDRLKLKSAISKYAAGLAGTVKSKSTDAEGNTVEEYYSLSEAMNLAREEYADFSNPKAGIEELTKDTNTQLVNKAMPVLNKTQAGQFPLITTKAEFDKLPRGSKFRTKDNRIVEKP